MRERTFASLGDFNEFLAKLDASVPPLTADMMPGYQGGPFTAVVGDAVPEGFTADDHIGSVEVSDEAITTVEQDLLNQLEAMTAMSIDQLSIVIGQRDQEAANHQQSHENFNRELDRAVKAARIRGYAEALCAGAYPGRHIMSIQSTHRDVFYRNARMSIERLIAAEEAYESMLG